MEILSEKMGYFGAHAVWSVSDGSTLVPMLVTERVGGWQMSRLAFGDLPDAVNAGRDVLEKNPDGNRRAILVFDGYLQLGGDRYDALFVEGRVYATGARATWAIPYRPASHGFAVHRPKILQMDGAEDDDAFVEAFWRGVDAHARAAEVWNAHLDDSV